MYINKIIGIDRWIDGDNALAVNLVNQSMIIDLKNVWTVILGLFILL